MGQKGYKLNSGPYIILCLNVVFLERADVGRIKYVRGDYTINHNYPVVKITSIPGHD